MNHVTMLNVVLILGIAMEINCQTPLTVLKDANGVKSVTLYVNQPVIMTSVRMIREIAEISTSTTALHNVHGLKLVMEYAKKNAIRKCVISMETIASSQNAAIRSTASMHTPTVMACQTMVSAILSVIMLYATGMKETVYILMNLTVTQIVHGNEQEMVPAIQTAKPKIVTLMTMIA